MPKAEWPKNEEQYGVVIPENHYEEVSVPIASVVAPAFVAIQSFFSENVTLIIMCVLLLIAVALLIAGLYLNIREQHKKEEDAKERKHHLFSSTQSAIRLDNQTNTQHETIKKLQKKKLVIGIRVQAKKPNHSRYSLGRISYKNNDGTYNIKFDNGTIENKVPKQNIIPLQYQEVNPHRLNYGMIQPVSSS